MWRVWIVLGWMATAPAGIHAQEAGWHLVGGGSVLRLNEQNGWGMGPSVRLEYHPRGVVGLDAALRIFVTSDGFYSASGGAADLGVAIPLTRGPVAVAATGGGGGVLGGDSDGSVYSAGGPYAGLRLRGTIHGRLGWSMAGAGRVWFRVGPALLAGQVDAGFSLRL